MHTNNNLNITIMKTKKTNRATCAKKANATKQVNNVSVKAVKVKAEAESPVADLPVIAETKSEKVSSREVLKAAGSLRATIKEERRGANVTIRLIAERAANGDTDAVNILCALCDIPRTALFTLNLDTVRTAVNTYYPYYVEDNNRKISVKPVGVWYSTKRDDETQADASQRVQRGYRAVAVVDYLDQLIKAAKSRAKGITPRCVDSESIYNDIALSEVADGITTTEIEDAKERKAYLSGAANVWHKDRNGFYI